MGQRPEEAIVYIRFDLKNASHNIKNVYLIVYANNRYSGVMYHEHATLFTLHQARRHINKLLTGNVFIGYKVTKVWMEFETHATHIGT